MWHAQENGSNSMTPADEEALNELTEQLSNFNWKDGLVDRAKGLLYSEDINDNIKGAMNLKAMLCIGREEVYEVAQEVIDAGVVVRLVDFLRSNNRDLQYPAAFCLTNVAAGLDEQTKTVVDAGAIDPLIGFLRSPSSQLRRQAVFCLANIAGSTPEFRVLLAKHPQYFPSVFSAAEHTGESKILELICWNLRNVCLLGGPTIEEVKPGIEFLLNQILKQYWSYGHWQSSVRFALEVICAASRQKDGRQLLAEQNAVEYILNVVGHTYGASSLSQSAFEALAWIVAFGREEERAAFCRHTGVLNVFIERALPGNLGAMIQELAFKCLACVAAEPLPDKLLFIFSTHEELFDICGRVFLGVSASSLPHSGQSGAPLTPTAATSLRECAGFLFSHCCLLAPHIQSLLLKTLVSGDVVSLLLEIIDFGSDQLRQRQIGHTPPIDRRNEQMNNSQNNSSGPGDGPPMTTISEQLTITALRALVELIKQGSDVQRSEGLPDNPLLHLCLESDAIGRLRKVLDTTVLPPEGFELGNVLIQGLLGAAP